MLKHSNAISQLQPKFTKLFPLPLSWTRWNIFSDMKEILDFYAGSIMFICQGQDKIGPKWSQNYKIWYNLMLMDVLKSISLIWGLFWKTSLTHMITSQMLNGGIQLWQPHKKDPFILKHNYKLKDGY